MKKQKKSGQTNRQKGSAARQTLISGKPEQGRRNFLKLTRNLVIAGGIIGGTGYVFANNVMTTMREHDLGRVSNGVPTIVQIHDPNCSMCLALQRETRKALDQFQNGRLDYVIANIRTPEGRTFANRYGVQHVTLLLFDSDGNLQQVLEGQRGSHQLRAAFAGLLAG